MVDVVLLQEEIDASGYPMTIIAERSGLSREMLYYKLKNPDSFKASDIVGLSRALNLTKPMRDKIFLS